MTPKEKANKLFSRYYVTLLKTDSDISEEITISLLSKQCALIALDEILNSDPNNLHSEYDYNEYKLGVDVDYWQEVKQEIEKI